MLLRLYEIESGRIYIGGHSIEKLSLKSLRNNIALVSQETFLFDGTIALPQNDPDLIEGTDNNILYLKSESTSNDNFSLNKIHKTGYVE